MIIAAQQLMAPPTKKCKHKSSGPAGVQKETPPFGGNCLTTTTPHVQSPSAQRYVFKELTGAIKVCAGCRLGYSNRSPPFDACLVHQETRKIKNSLTHQDMTVTVNAHYHATASCVQIRDPKFYGVPFVSKFVFSVVCDNVTLPESIAVIYRSYHWKSSHKSLGMQSFLQALYCYLW